jgi:ubiquinone/menaquinone biosynthesis C-methylase UbiE
MEVINPFEIEGEAARYDAFRPRYHHIPLGLIRNLVGKDFDFSLDVACGTGHSTVALSKISKKTVGCDQSEVMLREARVNSNIEYVRADAENLPFADQTFEFLNISMGFHWLNQEVFLHQAKRVLIRRGFLAIDNYGFSGKISANPEKQQAHHDLLVQYLPAAGRRNGYPTTELAAQTGLELVEELKYEHFVSMSAHEFANLIMTWSNFQVLGVDRKAEATKKMKETYDTIFASQKLDLPFAGKTQLYRFRD